LKNDYEAIIFYIPKDLKQQLISCIKQKNLTIDGILKQLISDWIGSISGTVAAATQVIKKHTTIETQLNPENPTEPKTTQTGRGHRADDNELVKDYLRSIHPNTARKVQIAKNTGLDQARVLIILNNLSGLENTYEGGIKNDSKFSFLVYESCNKPITYGIFKDEETGIIPYQDA